MPVHIHYAELRGDDAESQLRAFMQGLAAQPEFLGAELLFSPAQLGLLLCASRWADDVPHLDVPPGSKAWSFVVLDEVRPI